MKPVAAVLCVLAITPGLPKVFCVLAITIYSGACLSLMKDTAVLWFV
jgi:flagellar biosynthesis component FlhA